MVLIIPSRKIPGLIDKRFAVDTIKLVVGGVIVFAICTVMKAIVGSTPFEATFMTNVLKAVVIFLPAAIVYLIYARIAKLI